MSGDREMISRQEAEQAVRDMCRRIGLLHISYARTLVEALGEERGHDMIRRAIWAYGSTVGQWTRDKVAQQGLEPTMENIDKGSDLSPLGFERSTVVVEGESRSRVHNCPIADVWLELGEEELGGLYCLIDPAKMQAYDPDWTVVHLKKVTEGAPFCEMAVRRVTDEAEQGE